MSDLERILGEEKGGLHYLGVIKAYACLARHLPTAEACGLVAAMCATIGWMTSDGRVLVEVLHSCLTQPAFTESLRHTAPPIARRMPLKALSMDCPDSTVSLPVWECLTPKGIKVFSIEGLNTDISLSFRPCFHPTFKGCGFSPSHITV